jgi:hypothetical protein
MKQQDRNPVEAKRPAAPVVDGAVQEIRATTLRHSGELMQRLWAIVDDQLFNLSGHAGNLSLESDYFLAMRLIRRESGNLRTNYEEAVLRGYDEFWKDRACPSPPPKPESAKYPGQGGAPLSLMADDALEEQLAVTGVIEKASSLFQRELYTLETRLAHLLGRDELDSVENPIGPSALSLAFSACLKPLPLHLAVKLLIYKLFEQVALRVFGSLYGEVNAYLIRAGILPQLAWSIKRSGGAGVASGPGGSGAIPAGADSGPRRVLESVEENPQAYIELFESMQGLLDGWRNRMGYAPLTPVNLGGPAVPTSEVLNVLGVLQNISMLEAGIAGDHVKNYVLQQTAGAGDRSLARREEDVIDMVSLIFDFILGDSNLPDPVKVLISRLQIPVIKVAILERSFFGRKNHPARLLLNALAQAGIGLDMEDGGRETPVYKSIESVVNRVQDEFTQDVGLFSTLLDEFTAFMEKESQRTRVAEERTLQATHSKERVRLCKRKVANEIATRLHGKSVAAPVRSFLFNTWKDVMVLAYLRRDRAPEDWGKSLAIMDRLIWSMATPIEPGTRNDLVQAVPALLKAIKDGLEALSLDPQAVAETLRDLQACHSARLLAADAGWTGSAYASVGAERDQRVEIRDPELAEAVAEIQTTLPDGEHSGLANVVGPRCAGKDVADSEPVPEGVLAAASQLVPGQWFEFDEGGKKLRAKLSWKSQATSIHVFVNRKGTKVAEVTITELARRLAKGSVRLVEGASIPLMDRALDGLMKTLKGPYSDSASGGS